MKVWQGSVIVAASCFLALDLSAAQAPPKVSPDLEMGGCHEGIMALERAYRSLDDSDQRGDLYVIIQDLYRATDLDEGDRCRVLLDRGERVLKHGAFTPPRAVIDWDPPNPPDHTTITFDGTRSADPDGTIVRYEWDFDDGQSAEGPIVQHVYYEFGTFTVRLTVVDNDGLARSRLVDLPVRKRDAD